MLSSRFLSHYSSTPCYRRVNHTCHRQHGVVANPEYMHISEMDQSLQYKVQAYQSYPLEQVQGHIPRYTQAMPAVYPAGNSLFNHEKPPGSNCDMLDGTEKWPRLRGARLSDYSTLEGALGGGERAQPPQPTAAPAFTASHVYNNGASPSGSSNPGMTTYPTPISQTSPAYSQGATPSALSSPPTSPDEFLPDSSASKVGFSVYTNGLTPSMRSTRQTVTEGLIFGDIAGEVISPADGFDVCLQEGGALEDMNPAANVGLGEAVFEGGAEIFGTLTEPTYTSHQRFLGGMTSGGASDGRIQRTFGERSGGRIRCTRGDRSSVIGRCLGHALANELAPGSANSLAYVWPHERLGQGENELNGAVVEVPLAHRWALTKPYEMLLEGWPNANGGHLSTQPWSEETLYHGGNMLYAAQTGPIVSVGLPSVNSPVSRNWSGLTSSGPYMYDQTGQTLYEGAIQAYTLATDTGPVWPEHYSMELPQDSSGYNTQFLQPCKMLMPEISQCTAPQNQNIKLTEEHEKPANLPYGVAQSNLSRARTEAVEFRINLAPSPPTETAAEEPTSATVTSYPPEPLRMIIRGIDGPNMSVRKLTEITRGRGGDDPWCHWKGKNIELPKRPDGYSCILKFKYGNYKLPTSRMSFETGTLTRHDLAVQLALKFLEAHPHLQYDRMRRCQQAGHQHDPQRNCDLGGPPKSPRDIILTRIEQKGNRFWGIFENRDTQRDGDFSIYRLES